MRILIAILICIFSQNNYASLVVHHSDWEAPFIPTYQTYFGSPTVAPPTGTFASSSLAFNSSGNSPSYFYDQIAYNLGAAGNDFKVFGLSFDVMTESLLGSGNQFAIIFDTPTVRRVLFENSGTVALSTFGATQRAISSFSDNLSMHLDMVFNLALNHWDITLDGINIYSDVIDDPSNPFLQPATSLQTIRFSHGLQGASNWPDNKTTVYLDNVVISAIPQPHSLLLVIAGLLGLIVNRKRSAYPTDSR